MAIRTAARRVTALRRAWSGLGRSLATAAELAWRARPLAAIGILAVTIASGALPIALTWLTKVLVDDLGARLGGAELPAYRLEAIGAALIVTSALAPLAPPLLRFLGDELQRGIGLLAQDRLFGRINELIGLAAFERPGFHDRLRLAQQGGELAPGQLVTLGTGAVQSTITIAGYLVSVLVVSPLLAALALAALAPGLAGELRLARQRVALAMSLSPNDRRRFFYSRLQVEPEAAKELRLFGLGPHFRSRMLGEHRTINRAERALDRRALAIQVGSRGLAAAVAAVALVIVMRRAFTGELSAGDVVVLLAALATLQTMSSALVSSMADIHHALLMLREYRAFMDTARDLPDGARSAPPLRHAVELRDVWFRYDDDLPWVLRGVSLRIHKGEAVALVGRNGAGKSTLVKLLGRFYDPTRGQILWDGVDLRELDAASLRDRIGAVFQDFMSYDLSAAENVGLGDLAGIGDRARIEAAGCLAQVDEAIERLPRGWDTMLSRVYFDDGDQETGGGMLSGGQWQRLALARMFMRATRDLLILDEPSSGLDIDAEHAVHQRFRQQVLEATSILISHRFNTVRMADRIVVLEQGRIVEQGPHPELVAAGGEYARMFALQASGYAGVEG